MNRCSKTHNPQSRTADKPMENRLDVLTLEFVVLYSFVFFCILLYSFPMFHFQIMKKRQDFPCRFFISLLFTCLAYFGTAL